MAVNTGLARLRRLRCATLFSLPTFNKYKVLPILAEHLKKRYRFWLKHPGAIKHKTGNELESIRTNK